MRWSLIVGFGLAARSQFVEESFWRFFVGVLIARLAGLLPTDENVSCSLRFFARLSSRLFDFGGSADPRHESPQIIENNVVFLIDVHGLEPDRIQYFDR